MVKEIRKDGKVYFVCDCGDVNLIHIYNNRSTCSKCTFRMEDDVLGDTQELQGGNN